MKLTVFGFIDENDPAQGRERRLVVRPKQKN